MQLTLTADVIGLVVGQLVLGPAVRRLGAAAAADRLDPGLRARIGVVRARAVGGWLTVWRFLQGASGGGGIVLARAVAADSDQRGRGGPAVLAVHDAVAASRRSLAPVLGGVMLASTGSWRPMFWLLAVDQPGARGGDLAGDPGDAAGRARHGGGLRQTGRAFVGLARDRVFAGYALTVAFAYASLFGYISGSSFVLQDLYGLSATQFSLVFALNAAGMIVLGLLNARLVRRFAGPPAAGGRAGRLDRRRGAAAGRRRGAGARAWSRCWCRCSSWSPPAAWSRPTPPCSASSGRRPPARRPPCSGACMFGGGILVTPLMALGGEGTAMPMAAVVAGGALAALAVTVLLTRGDHPEPAVDADAAVSAEPIEE